MDAKAPPWRWPEDPEEKKDAGFSAVRMCQQTRALVCSEMLPYLLTSLGLDFPGILLD